jgi:site-specific recombinase XerD
MRNDLVWLQDTRHIADRTINVAIAQLRFFTMYVMHKPWDPTQIPTRKFDMYLPFVPTQEEAEIFISSLPDLKQQAMVSLMYSSGLRIGEVCNLRYEDVSRNLMRIHITHGKNRSDRYAVLSPRALDILTKYWYEFGRPTEWLFPKQTDNSRPIDTFYLSRHIHNHEEHLGWPRRLTCHSFRHAYGTHLYENGADLFTIKELLGHKSLNSTLIYIHLAAPDLRKVTSPFDTYGNKS